MPEIDSCTGFPMLCLKPSTMFALSACGAVAKESFPFLRSMRPMSMRRFRW